VVLAVRIGGGRARMHDELFPQFGHVGDEGLGSAGSPTPGARCPSSPGWRTISCVARRCSVEPGRCWASPRGAIDEGLSAVGLCELPEVTVQRLIGASSVRTRAAAGRRSTTSWCWTELGADDAHRDAAVAAGLVHEDDWERYGAVPLPYHYRVLRPALGDELGIAQPAGRAQQLVDWSGRVLASMDEHPGEDVEALTARPTPWWDRAVVPALAATTGGQAHEGWCNVVNHGLLPGLPADVVVEVPAVFDEQGVRPRALSDPPTAALDLLRHWAELTVDAPAALDGDVFAQEALEDLPPEIALSGPSRSIAIAEICADPASRIGGNPHVKLGSAHRCCTTSLRRGAGHRRSRGVQAIELPSTPATRSSTSTPRSGAMPSGSPTRCAARDWRSPRCRTTRRGSCCSGRTARTPIRSTPGAPRRRPTTPDAA
jgi:hypothetical protein